MSERTIAVCDRDLNYALTLSGALENTLYGRYKISTFTTGTSLCEYASAHDIDAVIISESAYDSDSLQALSATLMVLRENADFVEERAILIDRFQDRENLMKSVLKNLPDAVGGVYSDRLETNLWKTIGIYSPIRRCLQTSFALSLGQMLATEHKTLYMNFESFSGFSGWFDAEFKGDMVDLLYYFDCEQDKLSLRIPTMIHNVGGLDVLPPASSCFDTYDRNGQKWVEVLKAIEAATDYDYLILDLSDAMRGLLEVMEYCDRIYTLVKDDQISRAKIAQYEKWMVDHSRAEIISRTLKFNFPEFKDMPTRPEMLTHCELAGYVKAIVDEDTYKEAG